MFKNIKGLTLIEVLVSVVLTTLLLLYGTSFFVSAWQLNAESAEYSEIVRDVISNLEYAKTLNLNNPVTDSYYFTGRTKNIGKSNISVKYTLIVQKGGVNWCVLESKAETTYSGNIIKMSAVPKISVKAVVPLKRWAHINSWDTVPPFTSHGHRTFYKGGDCWFYWSKKKWLEGDWWKKGLEVLCENENSTSVYYEEFWNRNL